jgi:serine/threonine protein kinase
VRVSNYHLLEASKYHLEAMVATHCSLPDLTGFLIKDAQLLLGQPLGIGAFGRVHEATFVGPGFHKYYSSSPIAVKCLVRPSQGHERDSLQARELALHQRVSKHKNVITIYQVVVDNSHFYVVMERCEGDLFEAIVDRTIFRENDDLIRNVFLQLLDAVEFCHQAGIFHRDLKPRNILCSGLTAKKVDGVETVKVRLADFGLATSNRVSNTVGCGTSRYMSPGMWP